MRPARRRLAADLVATRCAAGYDSAIGIGAEMLPRYQDDHLGMRMVLGPIGQGTDGGGLPGAGAAGDARLPQVAATGGSGTSAVAPAIRGRAGT